MPAQAFMFILQITSLIWQQTFAIDLTHATLPMVPYNHTGRWDDTDQTTPYNGRANGCNIDETTTISNTTTHSGGNQTIACQEERSGDDENLTEDALVNILVNII